MEPNGVPTTFRHHRRSSSSSDRFLNIFSSSPPSTTADSGGDDDELNEDEILWTGDFTEPNNHSSGTSTIATTNQHRSSSSSSSSFPLNSGILAALPDFSNHSVIYRKPSISSTSSKLIPSSIPRPPPQDRDYSLKTQSMPSRKFQQSAPMNVPALSMAMAMAMEKQRYNKFIEVDDEKGDDDEMLPPHEIVARGSGMSPKTTFSVLEGVGRTLKGRDLRQVRNAVWRKTGFLDS